MIVEAGDIGHGSLHDWFIPTRVGRTILAGIRGIALARFIPTRVGRTLGRFRSSVVMLGSSPRVWGGRPSRATSGRNSPVHPHACGADSASPRPARSATTVHPHACGADERRHRSQPEGGRFIPTRVGRTRRSALSRLPRYGSSPRVWGGLGRFTTKRVRDSVHPHACGAD